MKTKLAKTAYVGYIYADGHAVVLHRESHPKAGEVEWAEVFEKIDTHCNFDGRIVFHHPNYDRRLRLALEAYSLRATVPSVEHGSENSKRLNLRTSHFEIEFKDGFNLFWTALPDVISDGITYQPEVLEVFDPKWTAGIDIWGSARIAKIHRTEKQPELAAVAA